MLPPLLPLLLLAVATVSALMGAGVSAAPKMGGNDADDAAAAFNDEEGGALEAAQEAPDAAQAEAAALLGGYIFTDGSPRQWPGERAWRLGIRTLGGGGRGPPDREGAGGFEPTETTRVTSNRAELTAALEGTVLESTRGGQQCTSRLTQHTSRR